MSAGGLREPRAGGPHSLRVPGEPPCRRGQPQDPHLESCPSDFSWARLKCHFLREAFPDPLQWKPGASVLGCPCGHVPRCVMMQKLPVGASVCPARGAGPGTGWTLRARLPNPGTKAPARSGGWGRCSRPQGQHKPRSGGVTHRACHGRAAPGGSAICRVGGGDRREVWLEGGAEGSTVARQPRTLSYSWTVMICTVLLARPKAVGLEAT